MKGEIPVFKKCCFCLPLRHGLLAWGYFKATADAILVSLITCTLINNLVRMRTFGNDISQFSTEQIISYIIITIFLTDFVMTIVFIVGGHNKIVKPIRAFYFFSIGMWVITCILNGIQVVSAIRNLMFYNMGYWPTAVLISSILFIVLVLQSYFLMLLRSEITKLRNNGEFTFVNNAAEAECTMICKETEWGRRL